MNYDINIWSRGIDRVQFNPARRNMAWRQALGIGDDEFVVGFHSRLVMEKALDVFADAIDELTRRGIAHRVLIIGEGPARGWLEARLPDALFAGFLAGPDLATGVASMDVLFFPSVTEAFGNVTLEAMACRLPVVAAEATGSASLVAHGVSGHLIAPGAISHFADAIEAYAADPQLRARHGAAGEARTKDFSWDSINQVVADTYIRLIRQNAAQPR
jgi:glycosyltransferase involved in cell wall biosynthesis